MKPRQIIVSFMMNDLSYFIHLCGCKPELDSTFYTFKGWKSKEMDMKSVQIIVSFVINYIIIQIQWIIMSLHLYHYLINEPWIK